ncbi:KR domain-containing protein [Bacillus velezensis]
MPLRENGVYIIAGGAGGLGFTFAEYLAFQTKCCLVLTGRSPLSDHIRKQLRRLEDAQVLQLFMFRLILPIRKKPNM